MNPLRALERHGQAVWLDFLARRFIADGELRKLIDEDGLKGVTSNPTIFEKAMGHGDEYDEEMLRILDEEVLEPMQIYERLAVADIKAAADVMRPVHETTGGGDGFVSLEVSPYLALKTEDTVAEARRLWQEVDRPNLMVKVPATPPGLPAIRRLIADGINVNVTLLFSQAVYREVAEAYIGGLEELVERGDDPGRVASVASFFVSRIDAVVDKELEQQGGEASSLRGKTAIANAKLAYRDYQRLFAGERFERLAARGARPQRLLWASTGTKNPDYPDTLYVEELIGPDTVNTMPPATMSAFRDHGRVRASLTEAVEDAERVMDQVAAAGISMDAVTAKLVDDGVALFSEAADKLLAALDAKCGTMRSQTAGNA